MFRVAVLSVGSTDKAANERRTISSGYEQMDTLGIEPRASRMLSGCDTTTPRARVSEFISCGMYGEQSASYKHPAICAAWLRRVRATQEKQIYIYIYVCM